MKHAGPPSIFPGAGALLPLIVALLFAVTIIVLVLGVLLYSLLGNTNLNVNSGVPVKPENETLERNTTDSIALTENLAYAPHNLPFLDDTLPFVGRENDVRNVTNIIVLYKVSIVGISGSPAFGKSTLAIHIGYKVAEKGITVGYINADEDDLLSEVSEGIGTREMLTTESVRPYFGKKEETMEDTKLKGTPKRWEEVKRWAAKLNGRALLVLDNCDNPLEEQDGELFKKIVTEIWKAGEGRLQLVITSQKKISFVNINFLPYPIKKLSLQSSVSLLKKMVEGVDVAMSDEQAEVIGNLSDGCPLALRIIGTELRSPETGVTEMIHDLTFEIIKVISDHSLQNVSRFQAIMNVAYRRLGGGMQYCAQQVSFFPGSFDHQAGQKLLDNGFLCMLVLVQRSLLDRYWTSYGDNSEKRYQLHKLIQKFFLAKYIEENDNSTSFVLWDSFNRSLQNFYSDYVTRYVEGEKTEWQELKFRAEAHNTRLAMAVTIKTLSSVMPSLSVPVVYGYYRRMVPMNSLTFMRVYYMLNDKERLCDILTTEVCSAVYADLFYQYYIRECKEDHHNCTLFKCEHVIHASNLLFNIGNIPVDEPNTRSFLKLFHRYIWMCKFVFMSRVQPCVFATLIAIHLLLHIVRWRKFQQLMHVFFCTLLSACLALSSYIHYSIPCVLGILEAFSAFYGHKFSIIYLLRMKYVCLCLLLLSSPPLPFVIGYITFVVLLIYVHHGPVVRSWSSSQALHSILYSNSEHRILLLCIYTVAIVDSVNSSINQNCIIEYVVAAYLVLLTLCITTFNMFPPLRIFGFKIQHLYSFTHVCFILIPKVLSHSLWQSPIPVELLHPIPWFYTVPFDSDLCYIPLSVVTFGLLAVMLLDCLNFLYLYWLTCRTLYMSDVAIL